MPLRTAIYVGLSYQSLLRSQNIRLPDQNFAALMFRISASQDIEQWLALLHTLVQATRRPEFRELNRSMTAWLLLMAQSNAALDTPLPPVNTLEDLSMMISEKPGVWAQQWKREGQADLLLRQIERRFGAPGLRPMMWRSESTLPMTHS